MVWDEGRGKDGTSVKKIGFCKIKGLSLGSLSKYYAW